MNNTIVALQELYVAILGDLTDTYEDICDGAPVGDYVLIPDMIKAIGKKMNTASLALASLIDGH